MRFLAFLLFAIEILSKVAFAQIPDPANFHLIYGNRDGTPLSVQLGADIEVPIWIATDPDPGSSDTLEYIVDPLASIDSFIISRNGGFGTDGCDFFNPPQINYPLQGYTNQAHLRINCPIFTGGDTIWVATFRMTTTSNTNYLHHTVCPFVSGGDVIWGMKDGVRSVIPTQTYGCLYFASVVGITNESEIPNNFFLGQNYPNPFNPKTKIKFNLPNDADNSLAIYNILGQQVASLLDGDYSAGEHTLFWDASAFPSGLYFARLEAGGQPQTIRMTLLK